MPVSEEVLSELCSRTLERTDHALLGLDPSYALYEGKVRDNYTRGGERLLVTTDRISAFDRVLGTLPLKGQVLSRVTNHWFESTRHLAKNHLRRVVDPQAVLAEECTPLAVELVVRAYLTGVTSTSIWTAYARGERTFCGHRLPEGMRKNEPLPSPIVTPSTKAAKGGHDESVSRAELLALGQVSEQDFDLASRLALTLFAFGQARAAERGLILADTKYELGKNAHGEIVVIDEMHTPDSSRYWMAASYEQRLAAGQEPESFDKEYVRRYLAEIGFTGEGPVPALPAAVRVEASRRYIQACEMVVGEPFEPDLADPTTRLRANLASIA